MIAAFIASYMFVTTQAFREVCDIFPAFLLLSFLSWGSILWFDSFLSRSNACLPVCLPSVRPSLPLGSPSSSLSPSLSPSFLPFWLRVEVEVGERDSELQGIVFIWALFHMQIFNDFFRFRSCMSPYLHAPWYLCHTLFWDAIDMTAFLYICSLLAVYFQLGLHHLPALFLQLSIS